MTHTIYCTNKEIIQKKCSSNCTNLQARNDFLNISKPAKIWWGTPFLVTACEVLFENVLLTNKYYNYDNCMIYSASDIILFVGSHSLSEPGIEYEVNVMVSLSK